MEYFPLFVNCRDRPCLVVGGGSVALRKIRLLLEAHAAIQVVAPQLCDDVQSLVDAKLISYRRKTFSSNDLNQILLVIAATDKVAVNQQVFNEANARNILCNSVDDPKHSSFITPAIVDRSPITIAISSGGAAPVLARLIREKLERMLPPSLGLVARVAGAWRARVKARLHSLSQRRWFWEDVFGNELETIAACESEESLGAIVEKRLDEHSSDHRSTAGEAWIVGAGPGDPSLLTIRAQQLLQRADVILYDRLVSKDILALARRDADFVNVGKPVAGSGCASSVQADTTDLLVRLVRSGKRVCRLKGGDPFIFGRGGEEVSALANAGLPYQIVPGITAAAACAAYAGIPLTHRDHAQSVVFLTGHGKQDVDELDWLSLARDQQTLAVYMGVSRFGQISRNLMLNGRAGSTPVAVIERGTTQTQRVHTGTLKELVKLAQYEKIKAPAMLIIGSVANYAKTQQWFRTTPDKIMQGSLSDAM